MLRSILFVVVIIVECQHPTYLLYTQRCSNTFLKWKTRYEAKDKIHFNIESFSLFFQVFQISLSTKISNIHSNSEYRTVWLLFSIYTLFCYSVFLCCYSIDDWVDVDGIICVWILRYTHKHSQFTTFNMHKIDCIVWNA